MKFTDLLAELKRRKVTRVLVIYSVALWAIVQIVTTIAPLLRLPDWVPTLVLVLLLAGLPIALILAWAFELTPEGVRRTVSEQTATPIRPHRAAYFGFGMLLALVGFAFYSRFQARNEQPGSDDAIQSIAVLPFADLSPEHDQEYFSDGITEELLDALAKIPGLRVPARTSSFRFKGQQVDIREIGEKLSVQSVLEGSVRKSGNRVRITAQLINANNGYHIWSDTYDRELTDVFAIQDEISRAIVDELKLKLAGSQSEEPLVRQATADSEAHALYLRARYFLNRDDYPHAIDYFRRAIARDSAFALAYAGLADTYTARAAAAAANARPDSTAQRAAQAAVRKAIELDPTMAEAHAALGRIMYLEDDLEGAATELAAAVRLNDNYAGAHHALGALYRRQGQPENAVAAVRKAHALDPLSIGISNDLGLRLWETGAVDAAVAQFKKTIELDPQHAQAYQYLSRVYSVTNVSEEAIRYALKAYEVEPETAVMDEIATAYAVAGNREQSLTWAKRYEKEGPTGDLRYAILLAIIYARLGDPETATHWLERAAAQPRLRFGEDRGAELKPDRRLDVLRMDPRYHRLLKKLELI
jgi:TolB-like protein/lipopolysaccharide biosynthesis regulator YciM